MRLFKPFVGLFAVFVAVISWPHVGWVLHAQGLDPNAVTGVYKGQFDCPAYQQHLTFTMSAVSEGVSRSSYLNLVTIDFKGHITVSFPSGSDSQATGAFTVAGQLHPNGSFSISPSPNKWEGVPPSTHVLFSLTGIFDPSSGNLSGNVSAGGCGKFTAARDKAETAKLIADNAQKAGAAKTNTSPLATQQATVPATKQAPLQNQPQATPAGPPVTGNPSSSSPNPSPLSSAEGEKQPTQLQLHDSRISTLPADARDAVSTQAGQAAYLCSHNDSLVPYDCSCFVDRVVAGMLDQGGPKITYGAGGKKFISPQLPVLVPSLNVRLCLTESGIKKYIEGLTARMNVPEQTKAAISKCASERFSADLKKDSAATVDAIDRLITSAAGECRRTARAN